MKPTRTAAKPGTGASPSRVSLISLFQNASRLTLGAAINTYAPGISSKVDLLLQQIKAHAAAGESLDASKWTMLLTFDIMGEVGFGKDFGGLKSGIEHPAIKGIHDHMTVLGIMATVPWLLNIAGKIPGATAGYAPFFSWCEEQVKAKYQVSSSPQ